MEGSFVRVLYERAAAGGLFLALDHAAAKWLVFAIPLLLVLTWWYPRDHTAARRNALAAIPASLVLTGLALVALSHLIDRSRPFVALGVPPLIPHAPDSSFPSDHTMLGVSLVAPVVWRYARVGLPLLLVALLVGFARVVAAVHWPSDILISAAVALALGALALPLTDALLARAPARLRTRAGLPGPAVAQADFRARSPR